MIQGASSAHGNARSDDTAGIGSNTSKPAGLSFSPAVNYNTGGLGAYSVVVADVNQDGKPDIVVANSGGTSNCPDGCVGILLGNGDGTFKPAVTYNSGGANAVFVAVADVNDDGKPDVVVLNFCAASAQCANSSVGVLLGNGDGTFQPVTICCLVGFESISLAAVDVNGDNRPDLIVGNSWQCVACYSGGVSVLLGNGDGTFQPPVSYGSGGYLAQFVGLADVDGDSEPDLLVANCAGGVGGSSCFLNNDGAVGVLLGNGDGTFRTAVAYDSGGPETASVAAGALRGDGKIDLLVANGCSVEGCAVSTNNTAAVLLGNGSGTFQSAVDYNSGGQNAFSVAVADVSGDGRPDVVVVNQSPVNGNNVGVLLGNGDGTLQNAVNYSSGGYFAHSVAVVDVNGDGRPDIVVANSCGTSATCSGTTGTVGVLLNASTLSTTTVLVSSLNPSSFGQAVTFTATVTQEGTNAPTGTVTFLDGTTSLGKVSLTNGTAALTTSSLAVGTHTVTASYSGNSISAGSTSAPVKQVVNVVTTTTSLVSSANPVAPKQSVSYTATVSSPYGGTATGTITFKDGTSTTTLPVTNGTAVFTTSYSTTGTHSVTATYSGDSNNSGSTSSTLTEYVENLPVTSKTVITTSGSPSFIDQPVTFTATVTSQYGQIPNGETVTFYDGTTEIGTGSTESEAATFTTSTLSAKTHTIKATYAGDATFKTSSGTVKQIVNLYTTTTTLSSSPNPSNQGQAVTLTAQVTSTGSTTPTGTVTFKNGTSTLGTGNLNASGIATLITTTLPVGKDSLTATYGGDSLNAESTSPKLTQTVN